MDIQPISHHAFDPVNEVATQSVGMLTAVINGQTYEAVAAQYGRSRTIVERRIKAMASQVIKGIGIPGLNLEGANFVRRLRLHRDAILTALSSFEPEVSSSTRENRIVSREEIVQGAQRIKGRSSQPARDVALFYTLFATGARPLEIARLLVRDYLEDDGSIRRQSQIRAEVAITGKSRPMHFCSSRLNDALALYLQKRLADKLGVHALDTYGGLDPDSRLFLSASGEGFKISPYGAEGQRRFLCRPILETYSKLFRYAELEGVSALSVRRTVIVRLHERGADEDQIGLLLGISERSAVRELLPKSKPTIATLVDELL